MIEGFAPVVDKDVMLATINAVVSIVTVIGSIFAAYFAFRANSSSRENKEQLKDTVVKVTQLEHNTDGIHRELLEQKGKASYLEGHEFARKEFEVKTADMVEGVAHAIGEAAAAAASAATASTSTDPGPAIHAIADVAKRIVKPSDNNS